MYIYTLLHVCFIIDQVIVTTGLGPFVLFLVSVVRDDYNPIYK